MAKRRTYYDVLSEALADFAKNGFDTQERLDRWNAELRKAAQASLGSTAAMERRLRESLGVMYARMVTRGGALKYHPGISKVTLDRIRPGLRAELDRRIMASANLIKINRQEAIEKTLRRFQGWATSIPIGGSKEAGRDKKTTEKSVRKSMSSLPFIERRVIIDQTSKLNASINDIIAKDEGAIAVKWHSNWRAAGYDYRPDHKVRDGKIYLLRSSWATKRGFVKPGDDGYYDQITAVAEEPFCSCYATYLYDISELPDDMLTAKGKKSIEEVAEKMRRL